MPANGDIPSAPRPASDAARRVLRALPSVDALLQQPTVRSLLAEYSRNELLTAVRTVLAERRRAALDTLAGIGGADRRAGDERGAGTDRAREEAQIALDVRAVLHARKQSALRRVVNATGVVLHTGLGRAPLAESAIEALTSVAAGYCNLEYDLASGERGDRHDHLRGLLGELTGAEDALVVNNNAAATLLALHAVAKDREVIVSRGQLVEIGGSYRMPDVMNAAGCRMVEVGTTNRTRVADYAARITDQTRVLLRVHTSNFRVVGFVEETPLQALVELAATRRDPPLHVIDDLGSGLLRALSDRDAVSDPNPGPEWDEPTVRDSLSAGADLVLFSGDKLLGGPQAGIIVGRRELIQNCRRCPLMRAFRPDKLTLAALEATLRLYRDPTTMLREIPTLRMLCAPQTELSCAAERIAERIRNVLPQLQPEVRPDHSYAGGGALPLLALPTWTVRLRHASISAGRLAEQLRGAALPLIGRVQDGAIVLDCRTLLAADEEAVPALLGAALEELATPA